MVKASLASSFINRAKLIPGFNHGKFKALAIPSARFLLLTAMAPNSSLPNSLPSSTLLLKIYTGTWFLMHSSSISFFNFSEASAARMTSDARFRFNKIDTAVRPTSTILPFCASRSSPMTFSLFNVFHLLDELFINLALDWHSK